MIGILKVGVYNFNTRIMFPLCISKHEENQRVTREQNLILSADPGVEFVSYLFPPV